jgi:hypothetical protein
MLDTALTAHEAMGPYVVVAVVGEAIQPVTAVTIFEFVIDVTAPADGASPLTAAAVTVGPAQTFSLVDNGDGSWSLRAASGGKFVAAAAPGGALAASAASAAEPLAQWRLSGTPDGSYAILAAAGAARGLMWTTGAGAGDAIAAGAKDASAAGGGPLFEIEEL